jgi:hypothetical protein
MYFTQENINTFATGLFNLFNKAIEEKENRKAALTEKVDQVENLYENYNDPSVKVKSSSKLLEDFKDSLIGSTDLDALVIKLTALSQHRSFRQHGALIDTLDIIKLKKEKNLDTPKTNIQTLMSFWNLTRTAAFYRLNRAVALGYVNTYSAGKFGTIIQINDKQN